MPDLKTFYNTDDYYHVLNHEVIHSTAKRLNRQVDLVANPFGSKEYSKEELVAEFGAKILSDMTNLQTT
jgi:antirestriction protein ArdC